MSKKLLTELNRMKSLMNIKENTDTVRVYHGTNQKINNFVDDFVGGENAKDQEGPGIYFTNDIDQAHHYGKIVHIVDLNITNFYTTNESISEDTVLTLLKMAPDWEETAQNWSEDPESGIYQALENLIQYSENDKDLLQNIWIDFYKYNPLDYVRNCVKIGIDGIYVNPTENTTHYIVYNPKIIKYINTETD